MSATLKVWFIARHALPIVAVCSVVHYCHGRSPIHCKTENDRQILLVEPFGSALTKCSLEVMSTSDLDLDPRHSDLPDTRPVPYTFDCGTVPFKEFLVDVLIDSSIIAKNALVVTSVTHIRSVVVRLSTATGRVWRSSVSCPSGALLIPRQPANASRPVLLPSPT